MNVEAVREHQRLARREVRRDVLVIQIALNVVGYQDHYDVGGLCGLGRGQNFEAGGLRLGARLAAFIQPHHHVDAGIPQVQRMRVALAAVSDNRDRAPVQVIEISVFFVKPSGHVFSPYLGFTAETLRRGENPRETNIWIGPSPLRKTAGDICTKSNSSSSLCVSASLR